MRRRSPDFSPPRRAYGGGGGGGGRRRSPSPRGRGGYDDAPTSLLVRNIPRDCSAEDLRLPFERYGIVKDVYLPRDYYTGQPRGFGFVQFLEPRDAAEAQYYLDHQLISGREITVVFAEENRKKPQEMRTKERVRGRPGFGGRRGRSPYPASRSRSPRRFSPSPRGGRRSRSISPTDRGRRNSPTPSPRHRGHARSKSPSPVRSLRRTRDRSPIPSRRSPSPPHRPRDVQLRSNGRDQYNSRSRSGSLAGTPSVPPRRRRSPSPLSHRLSPAEHQRRGREVVYEGSPSVEHSIGDVEELNSRIYMVHEGRMRGSGGGFDSAPRSPPEH